MGEIYILALMLMALGAVAGLLAGLFGVGGGIILVPGLYYIFSIIHPEMGFDPAHIMHVAVGTSLAVIVPTGLSSAWAHHRRNVVDFNLVRRIGIGIIIGVIIAIWVVNAMDAKAMKVLFASVMIFLAVMMVLDPARFRLSTNAPSKPSAAIAGTVIGFISTLIGVAGATLSVPYMSFYGISIHRAIGTASALGLVISIPAALGFMIIGWGQENLPTFSLGYVNLIAWGCIIPISVIIAPLGARIAHSISVTKLRRAFAVFIILVALNMWRQILMG